MGIGVFDPAASVGGLLHVLLPESSLDAVKAAKNPHMFAVMDSGGVFNIGKRNQLAVRKALWKAGLLTLSEDMGGQGSRTVRLELATGQFWVRAAGTDQELKANTRVAKGA